MSEIVLRGYAAVFDELTRTNLTDCDRPGITAPGAFDRQLHDELPVVLQIGHDPDAPVLARSDLHAIELFQDGHGLGFQASVWTQEAPAILALLHDIHERGYGVSINTLDIDMQETTVRGKAAYRINARTFDHLALTDSPNCISACCWLRNSPPPIRGWGTTAIIAMAQEHWALGYAAYRARPKQAARPRQRQTTRLQMSGDPEERLRQALAEFPNNNPHSIFLRGGR